MSNASAIRGMLSLGTMGMSNAIEHGIATGDWSAFERPDRLFHHMAHGAMDVIGAGVEGAVTAAGRVVTGAPSILMNTVGGAFKGAAAGGLVGAVIGGFTSLVTDPNLIAAGLDGISEALL